MPRSNARAFWTVVAVVTAIDAFSKRWAESGLIRPRISREVAGEFLRLTLVHNPGAAFGIHVGTYSRWVFMGLTIVALGILGRLYLGTRVGERWRIIALALVCGGAIGNLLDRIRSDSGVVDFIDVGVGATRWPTFNVADVAVSLGALLLAGVLWWSDQPEGSAASPALSIPGSVARERGEAA